MARRLARLPAPPHPTHTEPPDDGATGTGAASASAPPAAAAATPRWPGPARQRSQRLLANRAVRDAIVSLAGVVGQSGPQPGRRRDRPAGATWSAAGRARRRTRR